MSQSYCIFSVTALLFVLSCVLVNGEFRFTNVKCDSLDPQYSQFEYCYIKSLNRTYQYISMKLALHKVPINNVTMRWTLLKKANGYRPFLYNITVDACKFLKKPNNKILEFVHEFFRDYSNMNHTCPYKDDVFVEKLPSSHTNRMFTNIIPFPLGEYMMDSMWSTYGVERMVAACTDGIDFLKLKLS